MTLDACDSLMRLLAEPIPTSVPQSEAGQATYVHDTNLAQEPNALTTIQPTKPKGVGIVESLKQRFGWED